MCFSKAQKIKMDLLNTCDTTAIKSMICSWWTCGCPGPESNYTLVKGGEKIGWIKKIYINGGVIYVAGSNHTKQERLPIIPYMDTYMRLE